MTIPMNFNGVPSWEIPSFTRVFNGNPWEFSNVCYNNLTMSDNADETISTDQITVEEGSEGLNQRAIYIGATVLFIIILSGIILAVIAMVNHPVQTETIRDIVIIFMAVEFLLIGLTLILLIVQIARLTALLQNEIKPILDSTNDTVNTLRGTTRFLSNNLVQPVMKANSTVAAIRQVLDLLYIKRSKSKD
jgi:hypothetical protein